jgi:hypothetical protein
MPIMPSQRPWSFPHSSHRLHLRTRWPTSAWARKSLWMGHRSSLSSRPHHSPARSPLILHWIRSLRTHGVGQRRRPHPLLIPAARVHLITVIRQRHNKRGQRSRHGATAPPRVHRRRRILPTIRQLRKDMTALNHSRKRLRRTHSSHRRLQVCLHHLQQTSLLHHRFMQSMTNNHQHCLQGDHRMSKVLLCLLAQLTLASDLQPRLVQNHRIRG